VPFAFTAYPPMVDLPQHLSQMYLFEQALGDGASELTINWLAPGNLVYLVIAGLEVLISPQWSGRVLAMLIVCAWVFAAFYITSVRRRPPESAILAAVFVYNMSFYWGFVNFQIGWPIFVVYLLNLSRAICWRSWFNSFLLLVMLYASHSFWFALGSLVLGVHALCEWPDIRKVAWRISAALPLCIVAIVWFLAIAHERSANGVDVAVAWGASPVSRLTPGYLIGALLGGIRGFTEPLVLAAMFGWIALGLISNARNIGRLIDKPLFLSASMFAALLLCSPYGYLGSILLPHRFGPLAVILLVLAVPAPSFKPVYLKMYSIAVLIFFTLHTANAWRYYDKVELSGFSEAIEQVPRGKRVLGLDYIKTSETLRGRPFVQMFAYAQAFEGGELNFSFAQHGSSLVSGRNNVERKRSSELLWQAESVVQKDLQQVDYVLVNANESVHSQLQSLEYMVGVTEEGRWRLYKSK
jgi:hypothetical protein